MVGLQEFRGIWILCFLLLISTMAVSQQDQVNFRLFSDQNGLPDNSTRLMMEDHEGIIWFGLHSGLAKYDGYRMDYYRHNPKDSTSLSGTIVLALYEDRKHRLWVSTSGSGIDLSNIQKTSFHQINISGDSVDLSQVNVAHIAQDSSGRMWLTTTDGLLILEERQDTFFPVPVEVATATTPGCGWPQRPGIMLPDNHGNLWLTSAEGLYFFEASKKIWHCPEEFIGLPAAWIRDIGYDREGKLWVSINAKKDRLYYQSAAPFTFSRFDGIPFDSIPGTTMFNFDLDNRLWAGVFGDQVYGYDFRDSSVFLVSKINSNIPHERFIRKPMPDLSGNMWVPTEGYSIFPYPKGFHGFQHDLPMHQSCNGIFTLGDDLWISYREEGVLRLNRKTNASSLYSSKEKGDRYFPINHIVGLQQLTSGHLLFVGFDTVFLADQTGKLIRSFRIGGTNRAVYEDSKGRIWIGGVSGLHLFDETKGITKTYRLPASQGDGRNFVQAIMEDKSGLIWFGSSKGIGILNPVTEQLDQMLPEPNNPNSLPSLLVTDMVIDADNVLWVGMDMALVRIDATTRKMTVFTSTDGLAGDFICSVKVDQHGIVWMGTKKGISSYDPGSGIFRNYNTIDGLLNRDYSDRAKCRTADGKLYFGGRNGVDYFNPAELRINPTPPKMVMTAFVAVRKGESRNIRVAKDGVSLSFLDDLVEIEFAGMHYSDQDDVKYRYRLEPIHKDWVDLGKERKVLFSNLKPGDYVFHATAITPDGIQAEKDLQISIYVSPPFYQTWWFRLISLLCLIGGIIGYIRFRENRIHLKEKKEAEISAKIRELEKRALQSQMNPHFIYNAMNSIQQFIMLHDVEGAMKYLTKFSRILRTVLNMSAENRIPLSEEIKLIEDYVELENMRFPNKFSYEIVVAPELNVHTIEIPPFFVQPQVENAIRHGLLQKTSPGHLKIEMRKSGDNLMIIVEDDGIGREASRIGKQKDSPVHISKGLSIIQERLQHMHMQDGQEAFVITDLYDAAHRPTGTRVEIILPIED